MSNDRLLDARDVAELLGVKETWVRDAAREGRIPHVRIGRYVRFRLADVQEWIERQTRRAA